jgi:hypothetical protein
MARERIILTIQMTLPLTKEHSTQDGMTWIVTVANDDRYRPLLTIENPADQVQLR